MMETNPFHTARPRPQLQDKVLPLRLFLRVGNFSPLGERKEQVQLILKLEKHSSQSNFSMRSGVCEI